MLALIDGDIILYAAGFSVEKPVYSVIVDGGRLASFNTKRDLKEWATYNVGPELDFTEDEITIEEDKELQPITNAYSIINQMITNICSKARADEYVVYFSGDDNFRDEKAVTAPYKGNRSAPKPIYFEKMKQYMHQYHNAVERIGYEADDMMGMAQWEGIMKNKNDTIICTIDKDLDMIPGLHYDWNKDKLYEINHKEAWYNFCRQLLTGDKTDNILHPFDRMGNATADKILADCDEDLCLLRRVQMKYLEAFDDDFDKAMQRLRENASLLWILRDHYKKGDDVIEEVLSAKEDTAIPSLS